MLEPDAEIGFYYPTTTYEAEGWGLHKVFDGIRTSTYGVSEGVSTQAFAAASTTVTLQVHFQTQESPSKMVLYPRNDAGWVGDGFPVDFSIDVWNGTTWTQVVTKTAYPTPGNVGKTFTWSPITSDFFRINVTKLSYVPTYGYAFQMAEIELY